MNFGQGEKIAASKNELVMIIYRTMELFNIAVGLSLCRFAGCNQLGREWENIFTSQSKRLRCCYQPLLNLNRHYSIFQFLKPGLLCWLTEELIQSNKKMI